MLQAAISGMIFLQADKCSGAGSFRMFILDPRDLPQILSMDKMGLYVPSINKKAENLLGLPLQRVEVTGVLSNRL